MDSDSPNEIELAEGENKTWSNEEIQHLNSSLKICCIPLPQKLFLFVKYVAPTLVLLLSFVADIGSGIGVAVRHCSDGHMWWFTLTLLFLFAPAIMFIAHAIIKTLLSKEMDTPKKFLWIALYVCTGGGLLLWPLWGYVKKLSHALRAVLDEENSSAHLEKFHSIGEVEEGMHKMLKAFLQSAPQLLLQTYILVLATPERQDVHTVVAEIISIIFSLNSLAIVIVHFEVNSKHHPSRTTVQEESQDQIHDLSCVVIEYLWWMNSITARVLALALFAAVFKTWVFLICAIHTITIAFCLLIHHSSYTPSNTITALFMGIVYIFCFVEYRVDFGTLGRVVGLYVLYYSFTFVQNVCMVVSAYCLSTDTHGHHLPILVMHFVCFFVGVFCMLFYLGLLRPFYLFLLKKAGRIRG